MPNNLQIRFVEKFKKFTIGNVIICINLIIPIVPKAIFSGFFIAILFGTSSPNTSEKYERIIVIITIEIVFHTLTPRSIQLFNFGANSLANASAANALDRNPAKVIPICIVAKNLLGSLIIFLILFAFLSPSFACLSIFASFKDINAISAAAKKALTKINMAKTNSEIIFCFTYSFLAVKINFYYIMDCSKCQD